MISTDIKNSDIIAKAEVIKQVIIDRNVNAMPWKDIFDKYHIFKKEQQNSIQFLVKSAEDYISWYE